MDQDDFISLLDDLIEAAKESGADNADAVLFEVKE